MLRSTYFALALLALAAGAARGQSRDWPSSRFRGENPVPPPCTCRGAGEAVEVGRSACVATPEGRRFAQCVMAGNVTSWSFSGETCSPTASLTH